MIWVAGSWFSVLRRFHLFLLSASQSRINKVERFAKAEEASEEAWICARKTTGAVVKVVSHPSQCKRNYYAYKINQQISNPSYSLDVMTVEAEKTK